MCTIVILPLMEDSWSIIVPYSEYINIYNIFVHLYTSFNCSTQIPFYVSDYALWPSRHDANKWVLLVYFESCTYKFWPDISTDASFDERPVWHITCRPFSHKIVYIGISYIWRYSVLWGMHFLLPKPSSIIERCVLMVITEIPMGYILLNLFKGREYIYFRCYLSKCISCIATLL